MRIRTLLGTALTMILCAAMTGCTTDAYDKGDGEYSLLEAEMADVHVGGDLRADYLVTDDGERLTVTNAFAARWMKTADSTYRAVTYFNRRDMGAEVVGMSRVTTAPPLNIKNMKTDPVRFESLWRSPSGRYLNISIYLLLGSTDDENAIQLLGCHKGATRRNSDGTTTQLLTFYHYQAGVPQYYSQRAYVSIPLDDISADSVSMTIHTYDGTVTKTLAR